MNSVNLIGRLTKDPELKLTSTSKSVTSFTLAVSDQFQKGKTHFFSCVAWNKTAETIVNFVHKGQQIGITGRLSTRDYTDKNDNNRIATEIVVDSFTFIGSKEDSNNSSSSRNTNSYSTNINISSSSTTNTDFEVIDIEDDDDLPF